MTGLTGSDTKKHKSAFEHTAEELVHVGPVAFLQTIKGLLDATKGENYDLAHAVAAQDWNEFLSPTKFFTTIIAVVALGVWGATGHADEGPKIIASIGVPEITAFGIAISLIMHCALGFGKRSNGSVAGVLDGSTKIFQILTYVVMATVPPLYFLQASTPDDLAERLATPTWLVLVQMASTLVFALLCLTGLLVTAPALIARLYGVSRTRVAIIIICMALFQNYAEKAYETGSLIAPLLNFSSVKPL